MQIDDTSKADLRLAYKFAITTFAVSFLQLIPKLSKPFDGWDLFVFVGQTLLLLGYVGYFRRARRFKPPTGEFFKGIKIDEQRDLWFGEGYEKAILDSVSDSRPSLRIVAGPSGAGKSTLVRKRVIPNLQRAGWATVIIDRYDDAGYLRSSFQDALAPCNINLDDVNGSPSITKRGALPAVKSLIFFDQAERICFMQVSDLKWLVAFFMKLRDFHEQVKALLAIREDYYLQMGFLGPYLPPQNLIIELPGFEATNDVLRVENRLKNLEITEEALKHIMEELVRRRVRRVKGINVEPEVNQVATVLPLEYQVVGVMIDEMRKHKIDGETYLNEFGGKEGLVRAYYAHMIAASPDANVSKACLCALTSGTRRGQSMPKSDIVKATYYPYDKVDECLTFFCEEKWLASPAEGATGYQWSHDWLEDRFAAFAASEMDGARRDGVMRAAERLREDSRWQSYSIPSEKIPRLRLLYNVLMILGISTMLTRLIAGLLLSWHHDAIADLVSSRLGQHRWNLVESVLMRPYGDIVAAHLIWAWFTVNMGQFLVRLPNPAWLFVGVTSTAAAIFTTVLPTTWTIAIGVTAMSFWVVFLSLSFGRGLSSQSRSALRHFSVSCLITGGVSVYFGLPLVLAHFNHNYGLPLAFLLPMAYVFAGLFAIHRHATTEGIARWLGVVDQRRTA